MIFFEIIWSLTHCVFFFSSQRKNIDINLKNIPNAKSIPTAYHFFTSKCKFPMRESLYSTSFSMKAVKEYLFGDMYSTQPIHAGKSSLFLKNPENSVIGNNTIGTTADTDFASKTTLPKNRPNEDPFNPMIT